MPTKPRRTAGSPPSKSTEAETDSKSVDRFLEALAHPLKPEIEALRKILLRADAGIREGIKWNVPSFHCGEWFATFDLRSPNWVQIVLHRGAKAKSPRDSRYVTDAEGILKWITNDRGVARFVDRADVAAKSAALTRIVAEWARKLREETGI